MKMHTVCGYAIILGNRCVNCGVVEEAAICDGNRFGDDLDREEKAIAILRAALEEIGRPRVGYEDRPYCGTCIRWINECVEPCPGAKARAALEAAVKL